MAFIVQRKVRTWTAMQFNGANTAEVADFVAPQMMTLVGSKVQIMGRWGERLWVAPGQYLVKLTGIVTNDDEDVDVKVMHEEEFNEKYETLPDRKV